MDWMADAVAAADSGWAIVAIFLIGLYVLLWKYGGEVLRLARDGKEAAAAAASVAEESRDIAQGVAESIVTNHGSKNLGDAIDRLTEWMFTHMEDTRHNDDEFRELRSDYQRRVLEADRVKSTLQKTLADLDDRLTKIELKLEG